MTIKKCSATEECDNRYILQKWFWMTVALSALGIVGGSFAGGSWKKDIETRIANVEKVQSDIAIANNKLDTILQRLNK